MSGDIAGETGAAVFAELDRLVPDENSDTSAVGVAASGGGDSTALLTIAVQWARERGRTIAAATVDHGLRAGSAVEATEVASLCARLGVPHEILQTGDLRDAGGNLSAAARDARFELLGGWAQAHGLTVVLLGHTMDDQAETVLMRLARGSGAEGLSAMEPMLKRSGLVWLRPLLGVRRAALRQILQAEGIAWIEDPTNEDTQFDRVKARQALAALAPLGIDAEGLARTAWHLQRQRRVLERAMETLAPRARVWGALGEVHLDVTAMVGDEPDTALRLLADSLVRVSGAVYRPRFRALSDVLDALLAGWGSGSTLSGCLIRPVTRADTEPGSGTVLICREPDACEPMRPFTAGKTVWDRRWQVTAIGAWSGSARLGPLGEKGLAALRAASASGNWHEPESWASAPRPVRQTTPAIWQGEGAEMPELLAAPLAGYTYHARIGVESTVTAEFIGAGELP